MKTGKRILMMAIVGFFALATPVFASSYGGSCASPTSIQTWNGGGGNATSDSAGLQSEVTVAQPQGLTSASVLAWDGGGSNAMLENGASAYFTTAEESMTSNPITTWDGGGSNATSEPVSYVTEC